MESMYAYGLWSSYFIARNLINSINDYIGHNYLYCGEKKIDVLLGNSLEKTLYSHKIENFLDLLVEHSENAGIPPVFSDTLWEIGSKHQNQKTDIFRTW